MWRYDRPKKEGLYWCTLIAETGNGTLVAYGDSRVFRDVSKVIEAYRMKDEPQEGLGWIRDDDGFKNEKVLAWSENEINGVCDKLPEGAVVITLVNRTE